MDIKLESVKPSRMSIMELIEKVENLEKRIIKLEERKHCQYWCGKKRGYYCCRL